MARKPSEGDTRYRVTFKGTPLMGRHEELRDSLIWFPGAWGWPPDGVWEIWNPANPRGEMIPNMILRLTPEALLVRDLGGHAGEPFRSLDALIGEWRERYGAPSLHLEEDERPGDGNRPESD